MAFEEHLAEYVDCCICCGAPVPEGRMICSNCEISSNFISQKEGKIPKNKLIKFLSKLRFKRNEEQK